MRDDHAYVMQVKLCKANTRGVTTWVKWNLVSVCWELVSVQDRCTVGAEHTIGSEIILDTPDGTPR